MECDRAGGGARLEIGRRVSDAKRHPANLLFLWQRLSQSPTTIGQAWANYSPLPAADQPRAAARPPLGLGERWRHHPPVASARAPTDEKRQIWRRYGGAKQAPAASAPPKEPSTLAPPSPRRKAWRRQP